MSGVKFKLSYVDATTGSDGTLTIPNPTGKNYVYLLKSTYRDNVGSSFGVINIDSTSESSIVLRFRTLKDGSANANMHIAMTFVFAYN